MAAFDRAVRQTENALSVLVGSLGIGAATARLSRPEMGSRLTMVSSYSPFE